MKQLVPFHHYNLVRHEVVDPVEIIEERVVAMLRAASVQDGSRDSSVAFELKHSSGVLQFGRLLAKRRQLPSCPAAVGALLHDIYVIAVGRYRDHAHLGAPIAVDLMREVGGFSDDEVCQVEQIVFHHSDKHLYSDDVLVEFGKDADVLDSFLYPGAFDYYLLAKPLDAFVHYLTRAKRIWKELSLPVEPAFSLLDTYRPNEWFIKRVRLDGSAVGSSDSPTPFAIVFEDGNAAVVLPSDAPFTESVQVVARRALHNARAGGELAEDVIVVWPAIDRFEVLSKSSDHARLMTIGIGDSTKVA